MGWRIEKRFGGDAEVDVEVAGDHRSRIVVALSTDFRSECHLDEIFCNPFSEFFNSIGRKQKFKTIFRRREARSLPVTASLASNGRVVESLEYFFRHYWQ